MVATSADENLPVLTSFWGRLGHNIVEVLKIFSLWYIFHRKNWKEVPVIRAKILISFGLLWAYLWFPVAFLLHDFWRYVFIFPYFCALALTFVFALVFLSHGWKRSSLNLAFTVSALLFFWLVLINLPLIVFNRPIEPVYMLIWGWLWIAVTTTITLFLPIWRIVIRPNEVYYYRDTNVEPDGYRLISRPRPLIDSNVYKALAACPELTREELDQFISFHGPHYMRSELLKKTANSDYVSRQQLRELFRQIDDPAHIPESVLWIAALDNVWLMWDVSDTIWCSSDVRQLITNEGHPVDMHLQFGFSFNPHHIQRPETRFQLSKVGSRSALVTQLRAKMENVANGIAQLYFIDLSLRDALTTGSVRDFGGVFLEKMSWTKQDGIAVKDGSVQCNPILHQEVLAAEVSMMASRARALEETARLQTLIDKVLADGVPRELLAGLLYLESYSSTNPFPYRASNRDTIMLPGTPAQLQGGRLIPRMQDDEDDSVEDSTD